MQLLKKNVRKQMLKAFGGEDELAQDLIDDLESAEYCYAVYRGKYRGKPCYGFIIIVEELPRYLTTRIAAYLDRTMADLNGEAIQMYDFETPASLIERLCKKLEIDNVYTTVM